MFPLRSSGFCGEAVQNEFGDIKAWDVYLAATTEKAPATVDVRARVGCGLGGRAGVECGRWTSLVQDAFWGWHGWKRVSEGERHEPTVSQQERVLELNWIITFCWQ